MKETSKNNRVQELLNEIKLLKEEARELNYRVIMFESCVREKNLEIGDLNRRLKILRENIVFLQEEKKSIESKNTRKHKALENEIKRLENEIGKLIRNGKTRKDKKVIEEMTKQMDKLRKLNNKLMCFVDRISRNINVDEGLLKSFLEIADGVDDVIFRHFLGELIERKTAPERLILDYRELSASGNIQYVGFEDEEINVNTPEAREPVEENANEETKVNVNTIDANKESIKDDTTVANKENTGESTNPHEAV